MDKFLVGAPELFMVWEIFRGMISTLPRELAIGDVYKFPFVKEDIETVEKGEVYEAAMLILSPGSTILEHQHTIDTEVYMFADGAECECAPNESHSLMNPTREYMTVWAVKRKA